jgi:hypothetical protein
MINILIFLSLSNFILLLMYLKQKFETNYQKQQSFNNRKLYQHQFDVYLEILTKLKNNNINIDDLK